MNKPLDKGDYCVPRDAEEHKLVLGIARMLGVAHHGAGNGSNEELKAIWRSVYGDYLISDRIDTLWYRKPLSVPDFIAGMYALAEEKKELCSGLQKQLADVGSVKVNMKMNKDGIFKWNGEEWIDTYKDKWDRLHSLEAKSVLFYDILKRLVKLEKGREDVEKGENPYGRAAIGWSISIDPKASPKNIPFEVALMYMKAGRSVRRRDWAGLVARIDGHPSGTFSVEELRATDWEVVPEETVAP